MTKAEYTELKKLIPNKNIVIVTHKNPDGDAIGSSLALYGYLKNFTEQVSVVVPNDFPEFLKWMPGADEIIIFEEKKESVSQILLQAEIIFTLDFNHYSRTGDEMQAVLSQTSCLKMMIDHHQQPDDYATYTYSDTGMSSTAQMVYNFIEAMDDLSLIDKDIATNIYTGIMTDTGSFRFRSTTETTHRIVAFLIEKGADNTEIHENVFDRNSYHRMQLLATALKNLVVLPHFRTAYITLSQKELEKNHFKKGDYEGFVNHALSVNNVILACLFVESTEEKMVKI
ncbi:MAG TPA: DHH family phosphoesterase [Flavobacteriaceae bacterium]|nr:DHH family phosphoesterase [Flavobacteriaceae bacterium]